MANTQIRLKKSAIPSAVPTSLANGELAINFADGKLFYKNTAGFIAEISGSAGTDTNAFGTINANGTLVVAGTPEAVVSLVAGNNISITADAINDIITINSDISPAFNKANSALPNTGGTITGDLVVQGNVTLGDASTDTITINGSTISLGNNSNIDSGTLFIDAVNNRVGIGTTSPSYPIDVFSSGQRRFYVDSAGTLVIFDASSYFTQLNTTGLIFTRSLPEISSNFANTSLVFKTNSGSGRTERVRIDATGNVGIGTTSPTSNLHVIGTANITSHLANSYSNKIFTLNANTGQKIISATGDGRVFIGSDNGYNVVLSVDNKGEKRDSTYTMLIRDANNLLMSSQAFVTDYSNFSFGANGFGAAIELTAPAGNGMLRINKANTTIGQTNQGGTPDKTLRVWNNSGSGITSLRVRETDTQSTDESFGVYANNDTTPRLVVANGNVGINKTSPTTPLNIVETSGAGGIRIERTGVPTQYLSLNLSDFGTHLLQGNGGKIFDITNDAAIRIGSSGSNVSIGSFTIPTSTLHVFGTANITSNLIVQGIDIKNQLSAVGTGANAFTSATIAGANTAVGAGANAYALTLATAGNNFTIALQNGSNTAVGTGANSFTSATIAGANTAVGAGANAYALTLATAGNNFTIALQNGSNTAVGAGANAFTSATIAGSNTAVGAGANSFASATIAGANTAVGTGANNYSNATFVKLTSSQQTITGNIAITGSLSVSGNAFTLDTQTLRISDPLIYLAGNNYVSDSIDIGFVANYVNTTGQNVHTGFFRDHLSKEYYIFQGYDKEPDPNHIDVSGNNFSLAVLNSHVRTSNLVLGGINAIPWITSAFDKANSANVLAYNTGIGANAFASVTIAGANTAVGAGANAYAAAAAAGANAYMISVQNGSNTAVGAGANAYAAAIANTIAIAAFEKANTGGGGSNVSITTAQLKDLTTEDSVVTNVASFTGTVVDSTIAIAAYNKANDANVLAYNTGIGANAYALTLATAGNNFTIALQSGSNTAVGAGANAYALTLATAGNNFTIALQSGSNTAVGAGANAYANLVWSRSNTYMTTTIAGANTAVGAGANAYAAAISNTIAIAAFNRGNTAQTIAIAAFEQANTGGGGGGTLTTYTANVGNGSSNTFNVSHGLNSYFLLSSVRELSSGYIVYPDIQQTTANDVVISFVDNPTANQYVLLVAKVA